MSTKSTNSRWVKRELDWAINNRQGRIIPILIEECNPLDIHVSLPNIQHIDFRDEGKASLQLIEAWS